MTTSLIIPREGDAKIFTGLEAQTGAADKFEQEVSHFLNYLLRPKNWDEISLEQQIA